MAVGLQVVVREGPLELMVLEAVEAVQREQQQ
jgi:hypothetical protein